MKCVKDTVSGLVQRVSEERAQHLVTNYPAIWAYCPKKEWKEQRDV